MNKLALIGAVGALALGPAAAAHAAATQRVVVEDFSEDYELVAVDCSELGPYDFEVLVTGTERVRVTDVLDAEGTLLQTVIRVVLRETDTNTVTGATVPLKGAIHEVWDYASNTRTMSGKVWLGTAPGEGAWVQETGRIAMTLDTHEAFFVAGPHPAFFEGGIDPAVCAQLAG